MRSTTTTKLESNEVEPDIEPAVEHMEWCARLQSPGYVQFQTFKPTKSGGYIPQEDYWLDNRDPDLREKLSAKLSTINASNRMVLYTAGSYSRRVAKAKYALPSRLAFVDADEGADMSKVPAPSRRVASSATGEHWFYALSQEVSPDELQSINRSLTRAAGGDHGHSAAKKFRLTGFPNLKYKNHPIVKVIYSQDKQYPPDVLHKKIPLKKRTVIQKKVIARRKPVSEQTRKEILTRLNPKLDQTTAARLSQKRVYGPFNLRLNGKLCNYPGDDRSEILWGIGQGLKDAGATPDEVALILVSTIFWRDREDDGKRENLDRLIEKIFGEDVDESQNDDSTSSESAFVNLEAPADWDGLPIPLVEWILKNWIPLLKVTLLYGDGGTGKTLLALMLAVACALGLPFLGMPVRKCRVLAFLAENDSSDTHRTLADICKHYQAELKELSDMRVASRSGLDNVLMAFKDGTKKHTKLFDELLAKIKEFGAELVILETAADLFGGNENARNEVRTFLADCCGRIAREAECAVLLNAHPSVAGMRTGVGDGGSTAWNNTVRSRLSLYRDKGPDNSEDDADIRILEIKKSNLSKTGDKLTIRWKDNVYIREDIESSEDKRSDLDKKIIDEIRSSFEDGDPWSARHQSGPNYFVTWLKGTLKLTQGAAKTRLNNLLHRGKIVEVEYDKHRHLKGLCVPDQAEKVRAKQSAKVRKRGS